MLTNGNFFYTGGSYYCGRKRSNAAWEIDLKLWEVKEHPSMNFGRTKHAICEFKDAIYVFGCDASEKFVFGQT